MALGRRAQTLAAADNVVERPRWSTSLVVAVVVAIFAAGVAWLSMSPTGLAKDFTMSWTAAGHLVAGRNPYAEMQPSGPYPFDVPLYFPLPAALLAVPFLPIPVRYAGIAFVAVSFAIAALALARENLPRVAILFSFPALMAATLGQWSPLFLAATVVPAAQIVLGAKPTLGGAVFVNRPSRLGAALAGAVVIACFLLDPNWLTEWRASVSGAFGNHAAPITWAGGVGLILLPAFIWWRDPDARLLGIMALAPQLPLFYDQLLVTGIARTRTELAILIGASWVGGLAWIVRGSPNAGSPRAPTLAILLTIYLPALGIVAWRNLRRRPVSPVA